ncbi:hypothetical protein SUGI_1196880 [Cryptomeria japonica]|nr:hypothetical protein SUGI_1196880 [Cryptomeria japonica]
MLSVIGLPNNPSFIMIFLRRASEIKLLPWFTKKRGSSRVRAVAATIFASRSKIFHASPTVPKASRKLNSCASLSITTTRNTLLSEDSAEIWFSFIRVYAQREFADSINSIAAQVEEESTRLLSMRLQVPGTA